MSVNSRLRKIEERLVKLEVLMDKFMGDEFQIYIANAINDVVEDALEIEVENIEPTVDEKLAVQLELELHGVNA